MFKTVFFPTIVCRLGDNVEKYCGADRSQITMWRMRTACWIINAANTHSEYVILIAFLLQQWLYERGSKLHYTYTCSTFRAYTGYALMRCSPTASKMRFKNTNITWADHLFVLISRQ